MAPTFNFGEALQVLKAGKRVARTGWNGRGMFTYMVPPGNYFPKTKIAEQLVDDEGLVPYRAYIALKTVDNDVVPWVASQSDLLAEDWYEVSDEQ